MGDYREQLPARGTRYGAFVDPAGGSGPDAMTLAIAHKARRDDRIIIDAVREMRPPFNPTVVVDEFAELLKSYEVTEVVGALVLLQTESLSSLYGQRAMQPWRHGTLRFHGC